MKMRGFLLLPVFCAINLVVFAETKDCNVKRSNSKLVCYYGDAEDAASCKCTHVVLPQSTEASVVENVAKRLEGVKVLLTVNEFNEDLIKTLKSTKIDGLEIDLKKLDSKSDITDFISTIRSKLGSDLYLALSVPPKAEVLAKYYDFKALSKNVDLFILQTAFLGPSKNVTFHPSRLSGLWDMQNTDSVVDLVSGLGAPLSKVVMAAPVQAFQFTLQSEKHTAPGSPALEVKSITRKELCDMMNSGKNWTLERDQDQAGPYVFRKHHWIAFDDPMSMDIKAKYARVRGLAGLALKDVSQDDSEKCGGSLVDAAHNGLSKQSRAPRGAVLHSLEREILEPSQRLLDTVQVSPYRISRVIDVEGNVHVIRQDTRTEFECSRQGYFVHPRSCGRFYRCVKFDQLSDEFNVFEFDCPAGLAFDETVEVCVWPGSLKNGSPCSGSSEIAPVPKQRFICPGEPGYYADPENCRWFFACLDHGKSPLSAYEFRCPFGLAFDQDRLICEWPWLVPKCAATASILLHQTQEYVYGNLDNYNGLGVLGTVKLGGLNGQLLQPIAKVYTPTGSVFKQPVTVQFIDGTHGTYQSADGVYLNSEGLAYNGQNLQFGKAQGGAFASGEFDYKSQNNAGFNGLSQGIINAQEDARIINQQLSSFGEKSGGRFESAKIVPITGSVNIVGGGHSAVQVLAAHSSVDQGQLSEEEIQSVTPVPIAVDGSSSFSTVATFPFVQSVPLPSLVNEKFAFKGGVVANIPELQYKVNSPNSVSFQSNFGSKFSNGSVFVNYVSSTPGPVVSSTPSSAFGHVDGLKTSVVYQQGIVHQQPSVGVAEQPQVYVSSYNYKNQAEEDYNYNKAQFNSYGYTGTSTPTPIVPVQQQEFVSTYNQQSEHNQNSFENTNFEFKKTNVVVPVQPVIQQQKVVTPVTYNYQNIDTSFKSGGAYQYQQPVYTGAISTSSFQKVDSQVKHTSEENYNNYGKVEFQYSTPVVQPVQPAVVQLQPQLPAAVSTLEFQKYNGIKQTQYAKPVTYVNYSYPVVASTPKTNIFYEAKQTPVFVSTYTYSTPSPVKSVPLQPLVQVPQAVYETNYNYRNKESYAKTENAAEGYVYSKPEIKFEYPVTDKPAPEPEQKVAFVGYDYPKPAVAFEEKPIVVSTPSPPAAVTTYHYQKPAVLYKGYDYPKPAVAFEERPVQPVVVSTYAPPVQVQFVQPKPSPPPPPPVIVSTYAPPVLNTTIEFKGYNYPKPAVVFEEKPIQPLVVSTYAPPVEYKPAVVTTYHYQQPQVVDTKLETEFKGYDYPKPAVVFEERPAVKVQPVQPAVTYQYQKPSVEYIPQKPIAVSTPAPPVVKINKGYDYPKPAIVFEERPAVKVEPVQPAVTYHYQRPSVEYIPQKPIVVSTPAPPVVKINKGYDYPKPAIEFEERPALKVQPTQPAVVTTYHYQQPSVEYIPQKPVVVSTPAPPIVKINKGYEYPKPSIVFEEKPIQPITVFTYSPPVVQPVTVSTYAPPVINPKIEIPAAPKAPKPAVVEFKGYDYPKPSVQFVEQPKQYENLEPVYEEPIVAKKAYVTGSNFKQQGASYEYVAPAVQYEQPSVYVQQQGYSREKSSRQYSQSVDTSQAYYINYSQQKAVPVQQEVYYSTPKPVVYYSTTPTPIKYEYSTPKPTFESVVLNKQKDYSQDYLVYNYGSKLQSTSKPIIQTYSTTQSPPIAKYSFSSFDDQYRYTSTPKTVLSSSTAYVPVEPQTYLAPNKPETTYLPASTTTYSPPTVKGKFVESYIAPALKTTVPSSTYLPIEVPSSTYLPVEVPSRTYLPVEEVSTRRPVKVVKVVRPKVTKIVKENDFHPLLSAKLGAQCTCVSNTVKLNRKPKPPPAVSILEDEDEYEIKPSSEETAGVVVENYQYEPQRISEATHAPEVIIKSTTNEIQPAPAPVYAVKKRVKVRPVTTVAYTGEPVTEALEVFVPKTVSPARSRKIDEYSDRELADTVRKGLNLVKSAAKEGAKEGTKEVLNSPAFDRYGPGGWRSRDEKLQGTIDCQRAGLFRHPTQCNKFYACRWDCTKNRYTLHVFNCPVHLTFDNSLGACNWPSQGPACLENTLLPSD